VSKLCCRLTQCNWCWWWRWRWRWWEDFTSKK